MLGSLVETFSPCSLTIVAGGHRSLHLLELMKLWLKGKRKGKFLEWNPCFILDGRILVASMENTWKYMENTWNIHGKYMLYSRIYLLYWNFPLNPSITRDVSSGFINPDSYKSQRLTTWACVRIWWLKHHYSTLPEAWKKSVWVDFHTNWCLEEILRFLDYIAKNGTTKFLPMHLLLYKGCNFILLVQRGKAWMP